MKYSKDVDPDKTAKAYGYELECSVKDSKNLAYAIKGKTLVDAKEYVQEIIDKKRALPNVYHKKGKGHKKNMGSGSYPIKAARHMLKTLKNAENNAEYKGFDAEAMKLKHVSTYGGRVTRGITPRAFGRATAKNKKTTNIEIILEEVE
ncbi:MAG: 50S ribosomal protein L22 [Candidatus Thermoplasmatota archaeon]